MISKYFTLELIAYNVLLSLKKLLLRSLLLPLL